MVPVPFWIKPTAPVPPCAGEITVFPSMAVCAVAPYKTLSDVPVLLRPMPGVVGAPGLTICANVGNGVTHDDSDARHNKILEKIFIEISPFDCVKFMSGGRGDDTDCIRPHALSAPARITDSAIRGQ